MILENVNIPKEGGKGRERKEKGTQRGGIVDVDQSIPKSGYPYKIKIRRCGHAAPANLSPSLSVALLLIAELSAQLDYNHQSHRERTNSGFSTCPYCHLRLSLPVYLTAQHLVDGPSLSAGFYSFPPIAL